MNKYFEQCFFTSMEVFNENNKNKVRINHTYILAYIIEYILELKIY